MVIYSHLTSIWLFGLVLFYYYFLNMFLLYDAVCGLVLVFFYLLLLCFLEYQHALSAFFGLVFDTCEQRNRYTTSNETVICTNCNENFNWITHYCAHIAPVGSGAHSKVLLLVHPAGCWYFNEVKLLRGNDFGVEMSCQMSISPAASGFLRQMAFCVSLLCVISCQGQNFSICWSVHLTKTLTNW